MRTVDKQIISHSKFTLRSGMTLGIAIELRIRITGVFAATTYIQTQPHIMDGLSGKWEINSVTGSSQAGRGTRERTAAWFR